MSSLKARRKRGTEHAFTASGLDKTGDIVAQINAPRPADTATESTTVSDQQTPLEVPTLADVPDQAKAVTDAESSIESSTALLADLVTEPIADPRTEPITELIVETVSESVAEKVMRRLASPRKAIATLAVVENADLVSAEFESPALNVRPKDKAAEEVDTQKEEAGGVEVLSLSSPQLVQEVVVEEEEKEEEEATLETQQEPVQLVSEPPSSATDAKPALTAWEKLAAINASAKRSSPSSRRYIAHVPSELFDECRALRGDWPITTWFISLVAKYHEQVVKELVGSTPDASLGVVPHRVYRKREGSTKTFLLYFASTELGLAQQAFFQECLSSAGTTTEYIVAVLQSHADASRPSSSYPS
jgi:hypothetical protein